MNLTGTQNGVGQHHNQNGGGQSASVLNSWKEISAYIGRGVRTVQRWEQEFGLPVRRPGGHIRGSVIAIRSEIDAWLLSRAARAGETAVENRSAESRSAEAHADHTAHRERLMINLEAMKKRYETLLAANQRLKENLGLSLALAESLRREIRQPRVQELPPLSSSRAVDGDLPMA